MGEGDMAVSTETTAPQLGERTDGGDTATAATEIEQNNGRRWWRPSALTVGAIAVSLTVVAVATVAGWLGWQTMQAHDKQQQRADLLQVGRQTAMNLISIDYTTVDADIQRVLDTSADTFHDEFKSNATAFANVMRQARTKNQGSITEAGVESIDDDSAQILVTASVKTSSAGAAEQDPRIWRMRITVSQTPGGAKVSNVGFVS
jgi:Mce-associated membrane protein